MIAVNLIYGISEEAQRVCKTEWKSAARYSFCFI